MGRPRKNARTQEVGWVGLEPTTNALKGRCSTIELPTPGKRSGTVSLKRSVASAFEGAAYANQRSFSQSSSTPLLHHSLPPCSTAPLKKVGQAVGLPNVFGCYEITVEISLSGYGALRCERDSVAAGITDSSNGRATRTGDASKDVRNRRIRPVPSNNPDHKIRVP